MTREKIKSILDAHNINLSNESEYNLIIDFHRLIHYERCDAQTIGFNKGRLNTAKKVESVLDNLNSEKGTKEKYCLFCGSDKYNGKVGIVHKDFCIITELRKIIKNG